MTKSKRWHTFRSPIINTLQGYWHDTCLQNYKAVLVCRTDDVLKQISSANRKHLGWEYSYTESRRANDDEIVNDVLITSKLEDSTRTQMAIRW